MCELYEEYEHRIECNVEKNVFDIIFYGGNDGIKRYDYSDYHNCAECDRYFKSIGQPYKHHLVKLQDQVKLDNGEIWCQECVSKLTNQI